MSAPKDWQNEILKVIQKHRSVPMSLSEIYREMSTCSLVTDYHKEPWTSGGQPRYQCWIRKYLTSLVRKDSVRRTGRGTYSLEINKSH